MTFFSVLHFGDSHTKTETKTVVGVRATNPLRRRLRKPSLRHWSYDVNRQQHMAKWFLKLLVVLREKKKYLMPIPQGEC